MHFILFSSLGTYCCISFAIISTSACPISTSHEGLNLKLVIALPLAWAERELAQGCILWKMARKILVTWEIKKESTFALVAWEKLLAYIGSCQNLQRWLVLVLIPWYSARPDPVAAETKELLQGFLSPLDHVIGDLWSLIFKDAVYFHKTILYPKFNSVCGK